MIITEVKPIDEILGFLESSNKVLFVGCDGCTQPPRGLKEASLYAKLIEMGGKLKNKTLEIKATTVAISCDNNLTISECPYLDALIIAKLLLSDGLTCLSANNNLIISTSPYFTASQIRIFL